MFISGEEYPVFRIPAIVRANDGTLLAFCEGRAGISDGGNIDIVLKRSTDNGETWGALILVQEEGGTAPITIGNPAPVVDRATGDIHLLFTRENDTVFHTVSTDNGLTWAPRTEITANVKLDNWGWYATGPCHGIQLTRGDQAGRLVVPANHRIGGDGSDSGSFGAQILFSDDQGATWQMEVSVEEANGTAPNESTLEELLFPPGGADPGTGSHLYINSRDYGSDPGNRSEAYSSDGGGSYSVPYDGNSQFVTPICQGSLLRFRATDEGDAENRILFSSPNSSSRANGSLWTTKDETETWSDPKTVYAGGYAYSDMTPTDGGDLGILAECNPGGIDYSMIQFIRVNEAWLDEPPPPAENPAGAFWNFEEEAPGAQASTSVAAILDVGADDRESHLTAEAAFPYVAGAPSLSNSTALRFSGEGGLRIADNATQNHFDFAADDAFTLEAVLRIPAGESRTGAIIAKDLGSNRPSWWLRVESDGRVRFLVADEQSEAIASTGSLRLNDGNWHRVAAVKDAANDRLKLYIDFVLVDDVADITTGTHANAQDLCVGRFNASGREFSGDIDFVRITPEALQPGQFVGTYTQFDADGDDIPDRYERLVADTTTTLGGGDQDGDQRSDLIEFATGSSPVDAASVPLVEFGPVDARQAQIRFVQRELPDWLTLRVEFSTDLQTWEVSLPGVELTANTGTEPTPSLYTLQFEPGTLPKVFTRLRLVSDQTSP